MRALPAFVCLLAACSPGPQDPRPNVLLVTVDTLRADHLGSYGFGHATSPHLDALGASGVVFERGISASGSTAPSHASILTSRYVREHSIGYRNGDTVLENATTLAERFAEAGFDTAAFVSSPVLLRRIGLDRGFRVYDDTLPARELNREDMFERIAEETTRQALAWMRQTAQAPYFSWVHFNDPHGPYRAPETYRGRFQLPPEAGETRLEVLDNNGGYRGISAYQILDGLFLPSEYRSRYADEIFYADRWLGELLAALDAHASQRDAVVLFTSDHGEAFGENDRYFAHGHATTPDLAHVPFVLRAPGIAPERRTGLVHHVDVLPTLLELAGIEPDPAASGIALGPYLREARPLPERRVYCDEGREVSAYGPDDFVRLQGTAGVWDAPDDPRTPSVGFRYAWSPSGGFRFVEPVEELEAAIFAYAGRAAALSYASGVSPEEKMMLEALGYTTGGDRPSPAPPSRP